jgi:predicted 3-demethylubiquinone-9 3-methyltransferase (glyoxalase superfamily)
LPASNIQHFSDAGWQPAFHFTRFVTVAFPHLKTMKNSIYPCIWFDGNANEAAELYCSAFGNSNIASENPMVVIFELNGQKFMGLNGGPMFKPNASISFFVKCESPEEVEKYWAKLSDGATVMMPLNAYPWSEKYGWLADKFGVSWQLFFNREDDTEQKFSPCMMFTRENAGRAEEAINFYEGVFDNSSVISLSRYEASEHDVEGTIKHGIFTLNQQIFRAMDSSMPHGFAFTEGISFVVDCETQAEIDYFWQKLTEDGQESQCGWLKDKYGVSWQIVPKILAELMNDPEKSPRVVAAFMKMKKFDIQGLLDA